MFGYYFKLALASLRRNRGLTLVMILAIALGIGATMTTLTVYHVLSGDPLPSKSRTLFYPRLEPRPTRSVEPGAEPPEQMTRFDAETLLREKRAKRQAVMVAGNIVVRNTDGNVRPARFSARYTSADFFPMFEVPMRYGKAWTATEDEDRARIAVISSKLNDKLFGGRNSVGATLTFDGTPFRIVGVFGDFAPKPRFYDMSGDRFTDAEDVLLPFSTSRDLKLDTQGSNACWGRPDGEDGPRGPNAPCVWLQYWVELDSPRAVAQYQDYLVNYSMEQKRAGRFQSAPNVRLHSLMEWLQIRKVVPQDVRLQMWLAFGFLLVCLLNTVGLLLAKFMRRSGEYGVRRALGASRREIFAQCLTEAGLVGFVGGILGLVLALLGLWLVRQQPDDYARVAQLDLPMLLVTFAVAVVASLAAGLLPAWRACHVPPAIQLKTQ